jgi:hypothetical protein
MRLGLRYPAVGLLALVLGGFFPALARAEENATIINESDLNVEFFLKWSHLRDESEKIVLAPGESWPVSGPDGARLYIRYNSTPGRLPAAERFTRVITARVNGPAHPGYKSYLWNVSPIMVALCDS